MKRSGIAVRWNAWLGLFSRNKLNDRSHPCMAFSLGNFPFDFAQKNWLEVREFSTELINGHEHICILGSACIS